MTIFKSLNWYHPPSEVLNRHVKVSTSRLTSKSEESFSPIILSFREVVTILFDFVSVNNKKNEKYDFDDEIAVYL
jgi:hypothetical protein